MTITINLDSFAVHKSEKFLQGGYAETAALHNDDKDRTHDPCIGIVCDDTVVKAMLELDIECKDGALTSLIDHSVKEKPIIGSAMPAEHTTKMAEAKPFTTSSAEQPARLVVDHKLFKGKLNK